MKIYIGIINHRHGVDCIAEVTEGRVLAELAAYAREFWPEVAKPGGEPAPTDERELVETYFDRHDSEWVNWFEKDI